MRIAIIGAGFTGLAAAHRLSQLDNRVDVFEKEAKPGGLAVGFKSPKWNWSLEKHYHHLFTSDWAIRMLSEKVGHKIVYSRPKTSTWIDNKIYQFDSPISVLQFPLLNIFERLRTGIGISMMKFNPYWKIFESTTAEKYLKTVLGKKSWELLWEPLLVGKFGRDSKIVSAAWFWARIYKRSSSLGYPFGGFQSLASAIEKRCIERGARFVYKSEVESILVQEDGKLCLKVNGLNYTYDKIISTLPFHQLGMLNKDLKSEYSSFSTNYLGAVTLVLSINCKMLNDNSYWLNINDREFPFISVVDHTNYISTKYYNNEHIVYIGNYLKNDHEYFKLSAEEILDLYLPYIQKINPKFKRNNIVNMWVWKAPFAQPIITTHYSKNIPSLETSINNVYTANMQQVYPWDRGTNYAVELGNKVAELCTK